MNKVDIGEYNTLVNKYNEIYKENRQLKDRIEYLQRSISRKEETIRDLQDELVETPKESELINRIDKAINLLQDNQFIWSAMDDEILRILKGEDDE